MTRNSLFSITAAVTNESLEGIESALTPSSSDRILAISGVGDVPFALIASGCEVIAVDNNAEHMRIAQMLLEALQTGNYPKFLDVGVPSLPNDTVLRNSYFARGVLPLTPSKDPRTLELEAELKRLGTSDAELYLDRSFYGDFSACERLIRIRENLSRIQFRTRDVTKALAEGPFTKVYLSNVIGFNASQSTAEFGIDVVRAAAKNLVPGGLLYGTVRTVEDAVSEFHARDGTANFELDLARTEIANRAEQLRGSNSYAWTPRVFRKI